MTLLAAFQALLGRHTGQEDLAVGSPRAGRSQSKLAGTVGYFVNLVVLRGDLSGEPGFVELLERTKAIGGGRLRARRLPAAAARRAPGAGARRQPDAAVPGLVRAAEGDAGSRGADRLRPRRGGGGGGARRTCGSRRWRSPRPPAPVRPPAPRGRAAGGLEPRPAIQLRPLRRRDGGAPDGALRGAAAVDRRRSRSVALGAAAPPRGGARTSSSGLERHRRTPAAPSEPLRAVRGAGGADAAARGAGRRGGAAELRASCRRGPCALARRLRRSGWGRRCRSAICLPRSRELLVALLADARGGRRSTCRSIRPIRRSGWRSCWRTAAGRAADPPARWPGRLPPARAGPGSSGSTSRRRRAAGRRSWPRPAGRTTSPT